MDYIKEAEKKLHYYRILHQSIEQMDREISRLVARAGPKNLSAMVLDESGIRGAGVDETVNLLFQIDQLQTSKEETARELADVDKLLDTISTENKRYGPLLRAWYIEQKSKEVIAEELGYSGFRSVYTLKNEAIRRFAVLLFGIKAWRAV